MRDRFGRGVAVAVLLAILTGCVGGVTGEPPTATVGGAGSKTATTEATTTAETTTTTTQATTTTEATKRSEDEVVHGWPTGSRNLAGVYSLDWTRCIVSRIDGTTSGCNVGWMHNGYGSGDVQITIDILPELPPIDDGSTAVTLAAHDALYLRRSNWREEWFVDVDGKTVAIRLNAVQQTSQADMDEAHTIIDSIRIEPTDSIRTAPEDNDWGFMVVFTLATDDWDSG